jgi:hypothetical protein
MEYLCNVYWRLRRNHEHSNGSISRIFRMFYRKRSTKFRREINKIDGIISFINREKKVSKKGRNCWRLIFEAEWSWQLKIWKNMRHAVSVLSFGVKICVAWIWIWHNDLKWMKNELRNCYCSIKYSEYFANWTIRPGPHSPYPWDYWARDGRSECGYVGLTNLGATCIQHTFMMVLEEFYTVRGGIYWSRWTRWRWRTLFRAASPHRSHQDPRMHNVTNECIMKVLRKMCQFLSNVVKGFIDIHGFENSSPTQKIIHILWMDEVFYPNTWRKKAIWFVKGWFVNCVGELHFH